jgi:GntR family transcriptional regulator, transcriptional repressor for pyruvate dehydrogenase complex
MQKVASSSEFKITSLKHKRVSESVADQIRQAVFTGELVPGEKLPPERDLAAKFQTSRVALREALRAIENEGMIHIRRGSGGGAFVADFDNALRALGDSLNTVVKLGQVKSGHLSEIRTILEPHIARLASKRATSSDLKAIEVLMLAQEEEVRTDYKLSRKHDMEFHRLVVKSVHNPVLSIVVSAVNNSLREYKSELTKAMRQRVVRQHRNIFEALRKRDAKLAEILMAEHVSTIQCHLDSSR